MDPELVDRRERTFELLVVGGRRYSDVVATIASEYDITEAGVESDIRRMETWLPKLVEDDHARESGLVRLKELRVNRQEMRRLYEDLKTDVLEHGERDPEVLIEILSRIDDNLDLDIALSQSLGLTRREPAQLEVDHELRVDTQVVEVTREEIDDEDATTGAGIEDGGPA